jgi:hypothetical protein
MKLNTIHHPKVLRLKRRLQVPTWGAVGILESLWHLTATHAKDGAIGRQFTNEDLANSIGWDSDPDQLVEALVDSGWVDRCAVNRLVIHDWQDHCPDFVRANLGRLKAGFAVAQSAAQQNTEAPIPNGNTFTVCGSEQALAIPNADPCTVFQDQDLNQDHNQDQLTPLTPPGGEPDRKRRKVPPVPAYDPRTADLPTDLNTPRFRDAWTKWWTYRRERRLATYKPQTLEQRLREFLEMGEANAAEAILHSIAQGYQGIYPPKPSYGGKPRQNEPPRKWSEVFREAQAQQRPEPMHVQVVPVDLPALTGPGGDA